MKIYKIPTDLRAFIFDIDSTLYTNQAYAFEQVDCQVRQFAKERGITADEARRMVADYRMRAVRLVLETHCLLLEFRLNRAYSGVANSWNPLIFLAGMNS